MGLKTKIFVFLLGFVLLLIPSLYSGNDRQISLFSASILDNLKQEFCSFSLIFVGDMMFDRGTEYYINQNDLEYPFKKIKRFLKNADLTVGNLEGPIVRYPKAFSSKSLKFAFATTTVDILNDAGFDILSLANNHTLNMGQSGLEQTRSFLRDKRMIPIGDTIGCTEFEEKDNIVFFAINKTFDFNCSNEEIIETIEKIDKYSIVLIHWGQEYQLTNSAAQQELAHQMIDAGADLIIGHHPHVTQNIEEYKGKLIFYSLGNLVFDQHFSKETQQGLAVKLCFGRDKEIYQLFPVAIKLTQPYLMTNQEFLKDLAERSDKGLQQEIKNAIIVRYE